MPRSRLRNRAACFLIGLTACWFVVPMNLAAESGPDAHRPLVVVADPSDAECARRIGREYVQVESLFALDSGVHSSNYHACNHRAFGLVEFRLFVFRRECPSAAFWSERMARANPEGKVHHLTCTRLDRIADCDGKMQLASDIHRALVSVLPEHRQFLDANLKAVLDQLRARQLGDQPFASNGADFASRSDVASR